MLAARLSICLALVIAMLTPTLAAAGGPSEQQLREAAASGNAAQVTALLGQGASIDDRDAQGRTALLLATHHNRVQAARVLIDAGADVNAKDAIHDSPYLYAGARGYNE
ncbi:ankyrin repeat domain-containing protein, partial [Pseudomonas sp. GW460-13]|uniref:ankyrin repeat domain-containing protein n=1 Tax=Pseudomonas sp. GW460-13 TaxID=2070590 RepID=UPI000CB243C1